MDLEEAYDNGVSEAQAFIDRHPHGWPGPTMEQYGAPERPEDELEEARLRGWCERLGDEIGTEKDPTEAWEAKMRAFGNWPDWLDESNPGSEGAAE